MPRSAPRELTFASLNTFARAWPSAAKYLDNDDVETEISALLADKQQRVTRVPRGVSHKGLPITEVVVEDKASSPKQHIVWHLDPHAADEREALIAGFRYARLLLDNPELLRGRSLHLYISSPDDRARIKTLYRKFPDRLKLGVALRNRDRATQAGWTGDDLTKPLTEESSAGFRGLDAVIRDVIARVKQEPGSNFCLFVSGHSATAADGVNWLVGARTYAKRRFIGTQLEQTARVLLAGIFSKGSGDAWHLPRIRGTRATYPANTRETRQRAGMPDFGSNDSDLALYRDREAFGDSRHAGHLVTLNSEVAQLELEETLKRYQMSEDELRGEIKEFRKLTADGFQTMAAAGELAGRLRRQFAGLEEAEHLEILEFYGKQREKPSFQTGDMDVMDPQGQIVDEVTGAIIMLKDLAVAGSILKSVLATVWPAGGSGASMIVEEAVVLIKKLDGQYRTILDRVEELYEVEDGDLEHQVVLHMAYVETAFAASFNVRLENDFDLEAELELA